MKSKKGMTLVEIMISMTIIAFLAVMAIVFLNPTAQMKKARDTQRKKDLNRIKIAFEDYLNDKNCYPNQNLVDSLNNATNCKSGVFSPWLTIWPCDPKEALSYPLVVGDDGNCPKWYKIMTNLENSNDPQISDQGGIGLSVGVSVNYGVSSGNVLNSQ